MFSVVQSQSAPRCQLSLACGVCLCVCAATDSSNVTAVNIAAACNIEIAVVRIQIEFGLWVGQNGCRMGSQDETRTGSFIKQKIAKGRSCLGIFTQCMLVLEVESYFCVFAATVSSL